MQPNHRSGSVVLTLMLGVASPVTAQPPQAATIDSQLNVKVRHNEPPTTGPAFASVILLVGGNGVFNLTSFGDTRDWQGNFLIRSARSFLNGRLNVAMLDAENPNGLTNQRLTPQHAEHLGNAIARVRTRWPGKPVWLVGTSNGTLSAFNATARLISPIVPTEGIAAPKGGPLRSDTLPNGLVLTSTVTQPDPDGELGTVLGQNPSLASIRIPTLVMWHQDDACSVTPAASAMSVFNGLTGVPAAKKATKVITAGRPNIAVHACSAYGPHGYNEAEQEAINAIVNFISANSQPPPKKP